MFTKTAPPAEETDTPCTGGSTCPASEFTDLDTGAWYHEGVHFCIENALMTGMDEDTFAPATVTSRAMLVTILWRLEGSPVVNYLMNFEDVFAEQWYTEAILYRYDMYKGYDVSAADALSFSDAADTAEWAVPAIRWACGAGLIEGIADSGTMKLEPKGNATRAQTAVILYRFCENAEIKD